MTGDRASDVKVACELPGPEGLCGALGPLVPGGTIAGGSLGEPGFGRITVGGRMTVWWVVGVTANVLVGGGGSGVCQSGPRNSGMVQAGVPAALAAWNAGHAADSASRGSAAFWAVPNAGDTGAPGPKMRQSLLKAAISVDQPLSSALARGRSLVERLAVASCPASGVADRGAPWAWATSTRWPSVEVAATDSF